MDKWQGYTPTGLTPESINNMQLDAGAFFVDLDTSEMTKESTAEDFADILQKGMETGKCLGATTGGGTFNAVPETRQIEADGLKFNPKGFTVYDAWNINLSTTMKEFSEKNIRIAIPTAEVMSDGSIGARSTLMLHHYIDKFLWAGRLGDGRLAMIELDNVLNASGMSLTINNNGEGEVPVEFVAHQGDIRRMQYAPFRIRFFELPEGAEIPKPEPDTESETSPNETEPGEEPGLDEYDI